MEDNNVKKEGVFKTCYSKYEGCIEYVFERTGKLISCHPAKIMIFCVLMNCIFMLPILLLETENDVEVLYTPHDSQSFKDRKYLTTIFRDPTVENFESYQLPGFGKYAEVIVVSKNRTTIKSNTFFEEIRRINKFIRTSVSVKDNNGVLRHFQDLCAIQSGACVVDGSIVLTKHFENDFLSDNVTFPLYNGTFLPPILANSKSNNGMLLSTTGVKLRYYLVQSNSLSREWEMSFLLKIIYLKTNETEIAYSTSESLEKELEENTQGDILLFSLTFTLMLTYASFASASSILSCNNIANRVMLGFAGVLAPVFAIGSALGLVSAVGVKFTSIVGVMPFLVVGNMNITVFI